MSSQRITLRCTPQFTAKGNVWSIIVHKAPPCAFRRGPSAFFDLPGSAQRPRWEHRPAFLVIRIRVVHHGAPRPPVGTVVPSRLHHVSGWLPTTVCELCSTDRTHGEPSRARVLFLVCVAGRRSPSASKACRTETRLTGTSFNCFTMAGVDTMRRVRSDGDPYSAASRTRKSTRPQCLDLISFATSNVRGVDTFSMEKLA